jgi:hypothetical protein
MELEETVEIDTIVSGVSPPEFIMKLHTILEVISTSKSE